MSLDVYSKQEIFEGTESYRNIEQIVKKVKCRKALIVCGGAFKRSNLGEFLEEKQIDYCVYDGFQPNPTYENVLDGLEIFQKNNCDFLISIGGGSAIDVAKCIKAYSSMDSSMEYIKQPITDSGVCHLAMPTTAGTGSESTHFAVMYYQGTKMSVSDDCLLPEYVILDPFLLATLPDYQKKATLLDALCQATESYWSVKATEESRIYAREAISLILRYAKPYIRANEKLIEIFHAANLAGRAINITQTTLAHAMSYKLTSLYGVSHGHAVALCMPYVWEYLATHTDSLQEGIQQNEMEAVLTQLNEIYRCSSTEESIAFFRGMFVEFDLAVPQFVEEDIIILSESVNEQRLQNYPAVVNKEILQEMYRKILKEKDVLSVENQLLYRVSCDMQELERIDEKKSRKMLELDVREGQKKKLIQAADQLLQVIQSYGTVSETELPVLQKAISELSISINGYILENEVDVINYTNACGMAEAYQQPMTDAEKAEAEALKQRNGISMEHAVVLYRFVKLAQVFQTGESRIRKVFGVENSKTNIAIVRGMLCQLGLLLKGEKLYAYLNKPSDFAKSDRLILYWQNTKERFYEKKFNHYLLELRKVQMEMMDEIARVCEKHHLTYVLNYGSLLGAIRHKGFIPWDDDLDICMPREDYNRFLEIAKEELQNGCYLYNNRDFHDCWFSMMKVMKKDTVFVRHPYRFGEEDGQRIFIDVWPLDNVMGPEEEAVRKMKKQKSILTRLLRLKIKARTGGELSNVQKIRNILLKPVSEQWLIRKREQIMTQWNHKETDYWISGGVYNYIKETMPKAWYLPTVTLPYEGHMYRFPGKYENVLNHFYGNYMQVPPVDKRYTHAPFKVQMHKDGEIMYFNETQHRGRRSLKSKIKRKCRRFRKKFLQFIDPAVQNLRAAGLWLMRPFCGFTPKQKKLLAYRDKYKGKTCYIIDDSSRLTDKEMQTIKKEIVFAGDSCYKLLGKENFKPDFYCISEPASKNSRLPSAIVKSSKSTVFYTGPAAKGKKDQLKKSVRVAYRAAGKAPKEAGKLEHGYFDNGAGNFAFMLELAVYMGFTDINVIGTVPSLTAYHMEHFKETEVLEEADRLYEKEQLKRKRWEDIQKKVGNKCRILEYNSK